MYDERCKPIAWGVQIGLESEHAAFIRHILILRLKTVDQLDERQRPYADFGTVQHNRSCEELSPSYFWQQMSPQAKITTGAPRQVAASSACNQGLTKTDRQECA